MFRFSEYFSYVSADFERTHIAFYNCTLKRDVGDFRAGHFFGTIEFMCVEMELYFYDEDCNMVMSRGFELVDTPMDN